MPIGSMYSAISGGRLSALVIRCLGALDLHTHIRLRPILAFFRDHIRPRSTCDVLEIGCGDGINGFELAKLARQQETFLRYRGIDVDADSLRRARQMAESLNLSDRITFSQENAENLAAAIGEPPDIVLLADVLEHLQAPEALLESLRPLFGSETVCLISVPTPNYERFFGASFHRRVGHVRSGYRLDELNQLLANVGGRLLAHRYSTGWISNIGCAVYYRLPATRRAIAIKSLLLAPFRLLDLYNSPAVSCSLFAAYRFGPRDPEVDRSPDASRRRR